MVRCLHSRLWHFAFTEIYYFASRYAEMFFFFFIVFLKPQRGMVGLACFWEITNLYLRRRRKRRRNSLLTFQFYFILFFFNFILYIFFLASQFSFFSIQLLLFKFRFFFCGGRLKSVWRVVRVWEVEKYKTRVTRGHVYFWEGGVSGRVN